METKQHFAQRKGNGATFEQEISYLTTRLKGTDIASRDKFLSRQDTVDAVTWIEDIKAYSLKTVGSWPEPYLLALLKLSAEHHNIGFNIPEGAQVEFQKMKNSQASTLAKSVATSAWSKIPGPVKLIAVAGIAFMVGKCSANAETPEHNHPKEPLGYSQTYTPEM